MKVFLTLLLISLGSVSFSGCEKESVFCVDYIDGAPLEEEDECEFLD